MRQMTTTQVILSRLSFILRQSILPTRFVNALIYALLAGVWSLTHHGRFYFDGWAFSDLFELCAAVHQAF